MIERGELWWADLGEPQGSAPAKRRPVLVVSSDSFNRSRIRTVVCIVITSNLRLAEAPGNVLIPRGKTGFGMDSVANVSQVVTLDKAALPERLGRVDRATMRRIEAGFRRVLELG
ncbi:MAG TPA: type II toxin-antitoxin system PemK/MazF family toxin [Acidimicrobiales bacterium]|nr:type II toxin-antitoxin system PemK/MazF family toxin [Acidimicrobiales bacterium]